MSATTTTTTTAAVESEIDDNAGSEMVGQIARRPMTLVAAVPVYA